MKYKHSKEEIEEAVKESLSIAEVCRKIGIIAGGGNYKTLRYKTRKWNIDISHFTGAAWNVGKRYRQINKAQDLKEILIGNSHFVSGTKLKERLFKEGIKQRRCEKCTLEIWNNLPIPLEINHINGLHYDNRLENIEILCPNCHA